VGAQDPQLDALYVPVIGNSALTSGDLAICAAEPVAGNDLMFQSRGTTGKCALGAYERPPVRRVSGRRG